MPHAIWPHVQRIFCETWGGCALRPPISYGHLCNTATCAMLPPAHSGPAISTHTGTCCARRSDSSIPSSSALRGPPPPRASASSSRRSCAPCGWCPGRPLARSRYLHRLWISSTSAIADGASGAAGVGAPVLRMSPRRERSNRTLHTSSACLRTLIYGEVPAIHRLKKQLPALAELSHVLVHRP